MGERGVKAVETHERRESIIKLLYSKKYETIDNLASRFGVSTRTIRRDIESISLTIPIYTKAGRYGGGIYILKEYSPNVGYMSESELSLLARICKSATFLTQDEIEILENIMERYTYQNIEEGIAERSKAF